MEPDERRLVQQARQGAPDAVSELFRRHWQAAWRAAFAVCGRRELAGEIAQEAFVRAVSGLDGFDESRPLRPWLRRIAANAAVDELRREGRLTTAEGVREPAHEPEWPVDDEVVRAVARLAPEKRVVVALHYWLDYRTPEIAELLETPVGTVASRLSRALAELRADLEGP
jgi:RNA polymerase sigma-70 factor, ECF subfamily